MRRQWKQGGYERQVLPVIPSPIKIGARVRLKVHPGSLLHKYDGKEGTVKAWNSQYHALAVLVDGTIRRWSWQTELHICHSFALYEIDMLDGSPFKCPMKDGHVDMAALQERR